MTLNDRELRDLYKSQTARGSSSSCLSADEIVRAAAREISEAERGRVADHLMVCSDCAEEYQLISLLKPWSKQVAESAEAILPARAVTMAGEKQLRGLEGPGNAGAAWWQRPSAIFSPAGFAYAAMAALIVISIALVGLVVSLRRENRQVVARFDKETGQRDEAIASNAQALEEARRQLEEANRRLEQGDHPRPSKEQEVQIAELRRELEELSRPQLNAPIADLDPQLSRGQSSSKEKLVIVPSSANLFTLVLNVAGQPASSNYALEIIDQSGKTIWRGAGLRKSEYNTFTVTLARRLLQAGAYQIKLYGADAGKRELVEAYSVRIEYR